MTRALAASGHRVTVCTTDARDGRSRASRRPDPTRGVDVRMFPNLSNRLAYHLQFFTPVGLRSYLRRAAGSFDVAHLHACHNVPGAMAAAALARAHTPYVVSPNGTALPIERRVLAKRVFAATAGRHVLSGAAKVLAVSDVERRQLISAGVAESRIAIVPNPIDDDEFVRPPEGSRFRAARQLGDRPVVLFLGKLTPRKGVAGLIRAFARLPRPDPVLIVAGNDMGSGRSIDALVRGLGLRAHVIRTGLLEGPERLDALAAADVVAYPSRDEIFGLVPLEALLSGTPVVVCDDSGCGEVIRGTGGGLTVPYGNPEALAAAIESILSAPDGWRAAARAGAARARAMFGADVVCRRLEAVYHDAIDLAGLEARQPA